MKPPLQFIPTEVWVDVFRYPGKSRKELGEIANKLGRKFAEFLQFYLHEWGKRTIGRLDLNKMTLPYIPRTPLPENVKFFECIGICHFDSSALDFLRRINTLFLFNEVNLKLSNGFGWTYAENTANLRTIFDHLSPLIHGINSLSFKRSAIPLLEQYFAPKLAQVKMLTIRFDCEQLEQAITIQASINFCLNWLISEERDPAEPRLLHVNFCSAENFEQFCTVIRQQFFSAKSPCTFAIGFLCYGQVANFRLENNLGEQLDGQFDQAGLFQIVRHKVENSAREQLDEWVKEIAEKSANSNGIEFYDFTTIGQLDANAGTDEVNENGGEEADHQPSTSKKPRLT